MSVAVISLTALVLALLASCVLRLNVGLLAIVLAWAVGVYAGGMRPDEVMAGFPTSLFLTLLGVTLLFTQAHVNGTLDRITQRAVRFCRGNLAVMPVMVFALTAALSSIGPGNIASTALMAPVGMAVAGRYGIPPLLMAIMIANGANAGSLSPIAPTGIVANNIAVRIGLAGAQWPMYAGNLAAHAVTACGGYLLLGGWRLLSRRTDRPAPEAGAAPFEGRHQLTAGLIAALVAGVVFFRVNVGMAAFAGAAVLTLANAADEGRSIRELPWNVIIMVTGVTMLIAVLEKTGGMDLFTDLLARTATPATSTAVAAFFTAVISLYSSTTGVVLPALLPTVPGLIERMGGGDAMALVSSINVGSHLVDVSPLSTLGALCLAAAPPGTDRRVLFNQLLAWGLSMTIAAPIFCWIFFA